MSMYPEVRFYADPFEGLTVQLTELRGLIQIVPPLIEADRERRWEEIGGRPSDGEDGEVIDIDGAEAGPEEGRVCGLRPNNPYRSRRLCVGGLPGLSRSRTQAALPQLRPVQYSALAVLVEEDVRSWDRRFDQIKKRDRDFGGIALSELPSWDQVLHAQESYATLWCTIRASTRARTWGQNSPIDRPRGSLTSLPRLRTTLGSSMSRLFRCRPSWRMR